MNSFISLSKRVILKVRFLDFIVGGNYLWSPTKITRGAFSMGIQQLTSKLCAHSSIIKRSKTIYFILGLKNLSPAPIFVQQKTLLYYLTSSKQSLSKSLIYDLISVNSAFNYFLRSYYCLPHFLILFSIF